VKKSIFAYGKSAGILHPIIHIIMVRQFSSASGNACAIQYHRLSPVWQPRIV